MLTQTKRHAFSPIIDRPALRFSQMHPGKILGNASGLFVCADKVRTRKA